MHEILDSEFERKVNDVSHELLKMDKASPKVWRSKGICKKDWDDYMKGFKHIKRSAMDCLIAEYPFYYRRVYQHCTRAKKFLVEDNSESFKS